LARVASIRAADSAAKLVSTIGAAPLAITGGFFFDLVVVFVAAADLVVIFVAFGLVLRFLGALADLVFVVVFFTAAGFALEAVLFGVFPDAAMVFPSLNWPQS
jgi:hypothetical protein